MDTIKYRYFAIRIDHSHLDNRLAGGVNIRRQRLKLFE